MSVNKKNIATFFCLYIAQTIPMSFFSTVIPVMMRQGNFSLTEIGMVQLIKLPWILKFLWSPVIDYCNVTVNDYKRWIFSSELVYAAIILAVAFLNLSLNFHLILILIIISFVASATQDIATDALAVLSFRSEEKSLVNSMQSMGSFGGTMVGSGLLLLLFKQIGWNSILPALALFVVVALLPLYFNKSLKINREQVNFQRANIRDILLFFTQKGIWKQIVFLLLYYSSIIGTLAMLRPYMVDLGYDMKQIGTMSGFFGTAAGLVASFAGGFIIRKIGRNRSRVLFAIFIVFTTFYFYYISMNPHPDIQLLYVGILLLWGSYGMATVVVYTLAMDCVREGREGTDFTIQTVLTHFSGICIAMLSGRVADMTGYSGLFLFEFGLACVSLIYILLAFKKQTMGI
ncbi:MAG: MFS transporter [Dysgonamonadaceae bacterium]|jgi:predicted MFS family arabinose efflux permease|nr:MFS transporter [Dysgonamonadaceae bacterium]